ncbi:MAG: glycoside hydrolase family 140 protein, partial [Planctomycetota bacterium]
YWDHVDYIVEKAESLGMFIGMLPTWGDKWNKAWGVGPEVFTLENAEAYGEFLGQRYRERPIIWILGGDRQVSNGRQRQIIEAMARGLKRGDGGAHLMTFHPSGGRNSADYFHDSEWLDFNMIQSGHGRPHRPNYEFMLENLAGSPQKPTLDGEPCYEDHPVKGKTWNRREEPGVLLSWFDEWDVRVAAYQSMLAGACGHTYGDHNIWQMWLPGRPPKSVARTPWPAALHHPGSQQMKFFRELFESRPFWKMESDQSLVVGDNPAGADHARAARAADGSYAIVYLPTGKPVTVQLGQLSGESINAWWFNPRQNSSQLIGKFRRTAEREFTPPSSGRNNDWVLVIDDAAKELPRLGFSYQNIIPKVKE